MFEEEAHLSKEPVDMYHVSRTVEDACPYGFDLCRALCADETAIPTGLIYVGHSSEMGTIMVQKYFTFCDFVTYKRQKV